MMPSSMPMMISRHVVVKLIIASDPLFKLALATAAIVSARPKERDQNEQAKQCSQRLKYELDCTKKDLRVDQKGQANSSNKHEKSTSVQGDWILGYQLANQLAKVYGQVGDAHSKDCQAKQCSNDDDQQLSLGSHKTLQFSHWPAWLAFVSFLHELAVLGAVTWSGLWMGMPKLVGSGLKSVTFFRQVQLRVLSSSWATLMSALAKPPVQLFQFANRGGQ